MSYFSALPLRSSSVALFTISQVNLLDFVPRFFFSLFHFPFTHLLLSFQNCLNPPLLLSSSKKNFSHSTSQSDLVPVYMEWSQSVDRAVYVTVFPYSILLASLRPVSPFNTLQVRAYIFYFVYLQFI